MVEVKRICLQCESLGFQTLNNELIFFFLFQVSSASLMHVLLIKAFTLERGPSPHKSFSCICFTAV